MLVSDRAPPSAASVLRGAFRVLVLIGVLVRIGVLALIAVAALGGVGIALGRAAGRVVRLTAGLSALLMALLILLLRLTLIPTLLARFIRAGLVRILRSSGLLLRAARILIGVTIIVRVLTVSIMGHRCC